MVGVFVMVAEEFVTKQPCVMLWSLDLSSSPSSCAAATLPSPLDLPAVLNLLTCILRTLSLRRVVQLTPWLFKPAILFPEVQQLLDAEFAVAAFRPQ